LGVFLVRHAIHDDIVLGEEVRVVEGLNEGEMTGIWSHLEDIAPVELVGRALVLHAQFDLGFIGDGDGPRLPPQQQSNRNHDDQASPTGRRPPAYSPHGISLCAVAHVSSPSLAYRICRRCRATAFFSRMEISHRSGRVTLDVPCNSKERTILVPR